MLCTRHLFCGQKREGPVWYEVKKVGSTEPDESGEREDRGKRDEAGKDLDDVHHFGIRCGRLERSEGYISALHNSGARVATSQSQSYHDSVRRSCSRLLNL